MTFYNSFRSNLKLTRLEARDVPSGSRLFALSEDGKFSRVAVYEAAGETVQIGDPTPGFPQGYPSITQSARLLKTFAPYLGFGGGVRTAIGDVNGDGVDDLVTAAGAGGGPHIKVYDGAELLLGRVSLLSEFFAFADSFRGGAFVAVGQMDPLTARQEIVVSAGEGGGAHVRVFAFDLTIVIHAPLPPTPSNDPIYRDQYLISNSRVTNEFFAFAASFRGGVRVAAADVTSDGRADVIAAAGPGGGPHVRVFDVIQPGTSAPVPTHKIVDEFFAYDASFRGGVYVAAGELDGNRQFADVVTGPGSGYANPSFPGDTTNYFGEIKEFTRNSGGKLALKSASGFYMPAGSRVGIANLGYDSNVANQVQTIYVGFGTGQPQTQNPGPRPTETRFAAFKDTTGGLLGIGVGFTVPFGFDDQTSQGLYVSL